MINLTFKESSIGQNVAMKLFNNGYIAHVSQDLLDPELYVMWVVSPDGSTSPIVKQKYGQIQTTLSIMAEKAGSKLVYTATIHRFRIIDGMKISDTLVLDYHDDPITPYELERLIERKYHDWTLLVEKD